MFNTLKTAVLLGLCSALLVAGLAHAAGPRRFPSATVQAKIGEVGNGNLVADGETLKLASGVIIFNEHNRTITRGRLPGHITARLLLNGKNEVQRVWILAIDEIEADPENTLASRARARALLGEAMPQPFWQKDAQHQSTQPAP